MRGRYVVETDPVIAKAIESLPKAKALLENAKKMIVQRSSRDLNARDSNRKPGTQCRPTSHRPRHRADSTAI